MQTCWCSIDNGEKILEELCDWNHRQGRMSNKYSQMTVKCWICGAKDHRQCNYQVHQYQWTKNAYKSNVQKKQGHGGLAG